MSDLLKVSGLAKSFGAHQVLTDIGFEVRPGEILGLLGPNGSGKSTALNLISGFLPADRGSVQLAGRDITGRGVHEIAREGLVRTFQLPSMPHRMTVTEVLTAGFLDKSTLAYQQSANTVQDTLAQFELKHVMDQPASSLSGGQKKLLSVATALQTSPKLLCLDEPTAGVHVTLRKRMISILKTYVESGGACLVVEHDMVFVRELCTRCVVMDRGHIIADCRPGELEANPRVVEAYLGRAAERMAATA